MSILALPNGETTKGVRRLNLLAHDSGRVILNHLPVTSEILGSDPDRVVVGLVMLGLIEKRPWVVVSWIPEEFSQGNGAFGAILIDPSDDRAHYVLTNV